MNEEQSRIIPNLPNSEIDLINRLLKGAEKESINDILAAAELHHEKALEAHQNNPLVHIDLSQKLLTCSKKIVKHWDSFDQSQKHWLKGAILYYIFTDDEDHDLDSSTGFDDDVEVMNLCLDFVNKPDWHIEIED